MVGPDALAVVRPTRAYLLVSLCSGIQFYLLLSIYLRFISILYLDSYVLGDDALFCLFDLILYVHSTVFQLCGTVLPGFNQY